MKKNLLFCLLAALTFFSCSTSRKMVKTPPAIGQLRLIGKQVLPHNMPFEGTTTGGLSGIDYDAKRQQYYLICDDRSDLNPARFYTAKLYFSQHSFDSVRITHVTTLLQGDGKPYPNKFTNPARTPDPEALRYNPAHDFMVWSSEGERIVNANDTILANPSLTIMQRNGQYVDTFTLPQIFRMQAGNKGPRRNGGFEGLAFSADNKQMFVSLEEPRYEDGPRADVNVHNAVTRILRYDVASRQPLAQYAYQLDPVAYPPVSKDSFRINGIADIMYLGADKLLVLERSFSVGVKDCTIKLYTADLTAATDVSGINSLSENKNYTPVKKQLLYNFESLQTYIDNIEGVTFGPILPNGHPSLVFAADNNFSAAEESQFFVFEVIP
ncbi:esterase-like activity of phytase family protein [Chitinophaga sp. sic0106]|uniref:esterase-like activity of phytase family protein n=1 Tax=Chitinophaga sp. sic0106 TaxID=2854785 RepID=UPI001C43FF85|nr:esterase-like activity of phytase family protein [Chitinophaga sp. sic0106]MBV7528586.1 esterase-like activity of phytase family protein [Chitinophaga sp. sic0106]